MLLYSLKTLFGIESMHALPVLLFSDEALMRLVGFNAHQVRHGVCQRGAAKRQGPRTTGPICPDALADNMVKLNLRELETLFNGVIRALAKQGVFGAKVTGIVDATDLETTAQYEGCGQVTRKRKLTDKRGKVHEIEVTVYGWKLIVLIDAGTKIPLAAQVVRSSSMKRSPCGHWSRRPGPTWLATLACTKSSSIGDFWMGWICGGWPSTASLFVVPAKENMAVTLDAQAQAAAGEGVTVGRRAHTVRRGQGKTVWTERLETEVVGITGLTTYDQYGTPEHRRTQNRRDFQPNPINAVVVRKWNNRDYGPGGKTVFLTNASVEKPLQPFDDYDDRSLIENCCIKESKQQWSLQHPPKKTARAVRMHILFTLLMFALATAYRLQCEQETMGKEPVGLRAYHNTSAGQHSPFVLG